MNAIDLVNSSIGQDQWQYITVYQRVAIYRALKIQRFVDKRPRFVDKKTNTQSRIEKHRYMTTDILKANSNEKPKHNERQK